ncbi:DNA helicase RecQ [Parahaliea mediterranea]|uniref:DNA helicase RecQ n=1 Tax=Parahaliea mediterranea TaxID=651086 RepID=UPI000E2FB1E9|nr:DNA helicase RecQ [Parahaliea mediterranea]
MSDTSTALHTLQSVFGYEHFRAHQQDIVDTVIAGGDALVLMPTGGGKSLCYQVPALVRPGCAVVISPLIALMQDQVDSLRQLGVRASFLNSTLPLEEVVAVERALLSGQLDLLYIAPERLIQERCLALLERAELALFAIDEAHCVSQWGHDFRADYLQLSLLHERFPAVPRIALTATADARTRAEIVQRLDLGEARQFIAGFDRPNICYRIALKQSPRQQLLRFLREEHPGDAGIVYCLSRNKVEETAAWLCQQGFNALPYHAGLDARLRATHQSRFLREEGLIMVATIAFGMGIDKPDVRFVAHLDMPKTIEAYYQETGRAGRDGGAANAWMVYGLQDVMKLRQMMEGSEGSEEHKRAEQQRLNAMLGLCEITSCRRQALLHYFGDSLPGPCGNCDTCLNPVNTWDGTEAAQKALSAAYRTGQRFGVSHLIDVLRGSDSERVQQLGHRDLPTFGVGKDLDGNQWRSVFRQLVARGYLSVDMAYGALRLQEKCRPLLRGEERLDLRRDLPQKTAKRHTKGPLPELIDVGLWEALRDCRRSLAEEQGVPPYIIFADRTLQEMCEALPQNLAEMAHISGVGERKLDKYGAEFLNVIRQHLSPGAA